MDTTVEVLVILVMVVLSAVYSGMETALVSLSELKLRQRTDGASSRRAPRMLLKWRDAPNDVLTTLLIGNNLVNITASALATDLTETLLHGTAWGGWGIPIAVGAMTILVLVFGEVVPKTFAKHNPEKYLRLLPVVRVSWFLFYFPMRALVVVTRRIVGWMGGEIDGNNIVTEDDIEEMVRIGRADGSMSPLATKLLTGIFELDDKVAREIMIPRTDVQALPVTATLDDVLEMVRTSGYSRYPVYDGDSLDDIVGVLYIKDLFSAVPINEDGPEPMVADVVRKPLIKPWNVVVRDLLIEMQRDRVHLAVIASEYGGVAGILTLEDIVEEVFGPIYDEHDKVGEDIEETSDGVWVVDGVLNLQELGAELGVAFPDDDYETVAGMLMKQAGAMPKEGFSCTLNGYDFCVMGADATRVLEVEVRRASRGLEQQTRQAEQEQQEPRAGT